MRRAKRGFTLIEALTAAVLLAVGVTAVLLALRSQVRTESAVRQRETLNNLLQAKVDELSSDQSGTAGTDGDFSDAGYPNVTWTSTYEDTGIENLQALTVTLTDSSAGSLEMHQTTLVYTPPTSTSTEAAG